MGLRTKLPPMGGGTQKTYNAYIIAGNECIDVETKGFREPINPKTTFGTSDSSHPCRFIILNGKPYLFTRRANSSQGATLTQSEDIGNVNIFAGGLSVGTSTGGSTSEKYYIFGTDNGLYLCTMANSITFTQISGILNWDKLRAPNQISQGLGLKDGKVYLIDSGIHQITQYTDFTDICGDFYVKSTSKGRLGYVVRNQKIYCIRNTTRVDMLSGQNGKTVTKICGYYEDLSTSSTRNIYQALAIMNDETYGTGVYSVGYNSIGYNAAEGNFTDISGRIQSHGAYSLGVCSGALYRLTYNSNILLNNTHVWKKVTGYISGTKTYAYALTQDGDLYSVVLTSGEQTVLTKVLSKCKDVWGASLLLSDTLKSDYPAFAIYET